MAKVTKVEIQKKDKGRASIYVDGAFACGMPFLLVQKYSIKEGMELEHKKLRSIIFEALIQDGFEKSANYIFLRPRSEFEIRKYIKAKLAFKKSVNKSAETEFDSLDDDFDNTQQYFDEKDIAFVTNEIVKKLKYYSYIDDKAFVDFFIASHRSNWGEKKLKMELRNIYRVSSETIDEAFLNIEPQIAEVHKLAQKYIRGKAEVDFNKLFKHLFSKGFPSDLIKEAFAKLKDEQSDFSDFDED